MARHSVYRPVHILVVLLALAVSSVHAQESPHRRTDSLLDGVPFDRALWGVLVVDDRGATVFERNADRLFTPASTAKLVVSAAASALLPPRFQVTTSVYGNGHIEDGVLTGDLVVYGRGDPTFSDRCYDTDTLALGVCDSLWTRMGALADTLVARGVRHVTGAIIGDGSYFEPQLVHPAWETYDVNWWYAAPVSALGFNDNSVNVIWGPGASVDAPAQVRFEPDFGAFLFENRTRTVGQDGERTIDYFREPGTMRVWAEGTVPVGTRERIDYFALPDPNLYFAQALRAALADRGVSIAGPTESTTDASRHRECMRCVTLAEFASRPVGDWIFPILKSSQNWFAEMLLKVLGGAFGRAATWEDGLAVQRAFLTDSVGVDSTHFAFSDGSGLAAQNLVTPRALVQVLQFMRDHSNGAAFRKGLAVGAESGTLDDRYRGTPLAGRVVAKTGSIGRVNTLAGYVELPSGRFLTFAVMLNHHSASFRTAVRRIDEIVLELAR